MTTSRAIRGTRLKLLFALCIVFVVAGLLAVGHGVLGQLHELRESNALCRKQEEHLSSSLQVISDYKIRLERTMKEQNGQKETRIAELEEQLEKERNRYDSHAAEAKRKLETLQQHYTLQETNLADAKLAKSRLDIDKGNLEKRIGELEAGRDKLEDEKAALRKQLDSQQAENVELKKRNEDLNIKLVNQQSSSSSKLNKDDKSLRAPPSPSNVLSSSSSSTTKSAAAAILDVVKPLVVPSVSPKASALVDVVLGAERARRVPDGVAPIPETKEDDGGNVAPPPPGSHQAANEDAAHEQFDAQPDKPGRNIDLNDGAKLPPLQGEHIDRLGNRPPNYDIQGGDGLAAEPPLDENDFEEDDQQDQYGAMAPPNHDPAIRN